MIRKIVFLMLLSVSFGPVVFADVTGEMESLSEFAPGSTACARDAYKNLHEGRGSPQSDSSVPVRSSSAQR